MRYSYLTPHQYESLVPYIDTLLIATHSPVPLDIAVPHGASQWIADLIVNQLKNRFQGRMADLMIGFPMQAAGLTPEALTATATVYGYPVRFGVMMVDRTLVTEAVKVADTEGRAWLIIDWWQYFRSRTPQHRQSDLWMFLSQACPQYQTSHEAKRLGLSEDLTDAMRREGLRLVERFVNWAADRVIQLWQEA